MGGCRSAAPDGLPDPRYWVSQWYQDTYQSQGLRMNAIAGRWAYWSGIRSYPACVRSSSSTIQSEGRCSRHSRRKNTPPVFWKWMKTKCLVISIEYRTGFAGRLSLSPPGGDLYEIPS